MEGVAAVAALAAEVEAQAQAEAGQQAAEAATAATAGPSLSTPAQQQEQRRRRRVLALDIGGGLPVMYGTDDLSWLLGATAAAGAAAPAEAAAAAEAAAVSVFDRYARLLQQRVPSLFPTATSGSSSSSSSQQVLLPPLQLVTEFGRCLVAKAAFAAGRVEYTKQCGGRRVVVSGLGGDLLLRAVYLPHTWPVRVELCDAAGQPKQPPARGGAGGGGGGGAAAASTPPRAPASAAGGAAAGAAVVADGGAGEDGGGGDDGDVAPTDVVGPLCFQGDKLAEAAPLPAAAPGDWVLVPDVGAYTLSMHSRYNSRCSPPVWAFRRVVGGGGGGEVGVGGVGEGQVEMGGLGERVGGAVEEGAGAGAGGKGRRSGGRGLALPAEWGGDVRRCGAYEFVMLRRGENVEDVLAFWNRV